MIAVPDSKLVEHLLHIELVLARPLLRRLEAVFLDLGWRF